MRRFLRDNGLSLAMFGLFLLAWCGQIGTGFRDNNEDRKDRGQSEIGLASYLRSGHFVEATFENWESEFLQMGTYVALTACLVQRGSPESNDPEAPPEEAELTEDSPAPAKRQGVVRWLYARSLAPTLFAMFLISFFLHALGGAMEATTENLAKGQPPVSMLEFMEGSKFWFQSFQNWQSEFLSIGVFVVLGIYLRQKGSPESKPVNAPHGKTGG